METVPVLLPAFEIPLHLASPSSPRLEPHPSHCGLRDCFISWPLHHSPNRWSVFDSFDGQDIDDYALSSYYPSAAHSRRAAELKSRARSRLMPPFAFDPYPRTVSCAPRNTSGHSSRQRKSSIPSSLKRQACPSTPVRSLPDTQIKHTPASTVASSIPTPSHKPLLLSPP